MVRDENKTQNLQILQQETLQSPAQNPKGRGEGITDSWACLGKIFNKFVINF